MFCTLKSRAINFFSSWRTFDCKVGWFLFISPLSYWLVSLCETVGSFFDLVDVVACFYHRIALILKRTVAHGHGVFVHKNIVGNWTSTAQPFTFFNTWTTLVVSGSAFVIGLEQCVSYKKWSRFNESYLCFNLLFGEWLWENLWKG